jgi:hypothetical protein
MHTTVFLRSIETNRTVFNAGGAITAKFVVGHDNSSATVDQMLILKRDREGWTAEMPMDGFPPQKTANDAALKLADWMERMAVAIKHGTYDEIYINIL